MTHPRTLIIGLDGATFDLIDPLIRAGELPTLKRLIDEGARGLLQSWPNTNSAAAWTSMVTGYNSGQHSIYHFADAIMRHGQPWRPVTGSDRKKEAFWRILSDAGQRVGVINVPISYPAERINGFMLAGMDTPRVNSPGFAYPPELTQELSEQGISYKIDVANLGQASKHNPHRLPESVERLIEARSRAVLHLMRTREWDLLMAVFVATDRVQHFFWPRDLQSVERQDWKPIQRVYQLIDLFLGEAISAAGSNTRVMLVSDHGFGHERSGKRGLNKLFAQLGFLRFKKAESQLVGRTLNRMLVYGRRIIPERFQDPLARAMPGLHLRAVNEHRFSGIDWSGTRAFAGSNGGRVWVNLEGRELEGTVLPDEFHDVREEVAQVLLSLTDATSGQRIVRAVHRSEDIYRGPYADRSADLLIKWNYDTLQDNLCYGSGEQRIVVSSSENDSSPNRWNGTHRSDGILIAWGPQVRRGASVTGANIYDIAPTVLYLHGHPIPDDLDGKVLTELFTRDLLQERPIERYKAKAANHQTASPLDASETREIEERLRSLGYIE